ncbi:uncharacterized protein LOC118477609 [Aplysia californica]|uniref:Uncharacterized protein LOC118477609 n=1 Tax=Aplysia californica TaxID=6500 RepID=A0ABM1VSL5_APLCA|nr:uncharacterized protein LOC118477609 [Aplysia californica]
MFYYFGDKPCAHEPYHQVAGGFGIYHNEPLVRQAILTPWLACGLVKNCICPRNQRSVQFCPRGKAALGLPKYARCHRTDQSALTIILAKLFVRDFPHAVMKNRNKFYSVERGDRSNYFEELKSLQRKGLKHE